MQRSKLLKAGIVGTVITAICCFTPVLVVVLGLLGLSSIVGYLDYILLPVLGLFILLSVFAFWRARRQS